MTVELTPAQRADLEGLAESDLPASKYASLVLDVARNGEDVTNGKAGARS